MQLSARLEKLEAKALPKEPPREWIQVISHEGEPEPPEIEQYQREGKKRHPHHHC